MGRHEVLIEFPKIDGTVTVELDEARAPETVKAILAKLPIRVVMNRWGDELYTEPMPVSMVEEENARSLVELMDVAYWPEGKALCLFFGPTPISKPNEIRPYSPVNLIGRIVSGQNVLGTVQESMPVIIRRS